eukprot:7857821-Alexandrium_andersonii.AAC.1
MTPGDPAGAGPPRHLPLPGGQCRCRQTVRAGPAAPFHPENPERQPGWPAGQAGPQGGAAEGLACPDKRGGNHRPWPLPLQAPPS